MSDFAPAYEYMIRNEVLRYHQPGEVWYTETPGDKGGATAWGITEATARANGFTEPMNTMLEMDAITIYKKAFWIWGGVQSQQVASKLFDAGVNIGVSRAAKQAQRALGFQPQDWDGRLGPKTLAAINGETPKDFLSAFVTQLLNRYGAIVKQDPSQLKFLKGWTRRALQLPPED